MHTPRFIDLFAGCGGLSLGLLKAGWQGVFAIEQNRDAFLTYRHNLVQNDALDYDWPLWLPETEHDIEEFLDNYSAELSRLEGKVDLIAGGPPCQGFSPAGRRNPKDPRNRMAEKYIAVVQAVKPRFLLLENVRGFNATFKKGSRKQSRVPYSEIVRQRLRKEGYEVRFRIVPSADWGVPQLRPRFILIATRNDVADDWDPFEEWYGMRERFLTVRGLSPDIPQVTRDAIGDLEVDGKELSDCLDSPVRGFKEIRYQDPRNPSPFLKLMRAGLSKDSSPNSLRLPRHKPEIRDRFERILRECPRGKTLNHEQRERYGLKKHSITPLCPDRPSATMTTLPDDYLHYSEARILTVREMARIQSFPDWFELLGQYTTGGSKRKTSCPRYTQVGNAVPPLLGEALGEFLLDVNLHPQYLDQGAA